VAQAAIDMGMRGIVSQGFIDFPTPDQPEPAKNIKIAETFIDKWKDPLAADLPALFLPYTLYLYCRNAGHSQAGGTAKRTSFISPMWRKHGMR